MGGLFGSSSAGSGASAQANALEARAVEELDKLQIPDIEKQKIMLEMPKLVGLLQSETTDPSAFEALEIPQELRDNILGAIESEKEYAEQGITEEDRARLENIQRMTQADEQARQESIMQSMAERGASGSGSELAQRLMANQASADRAQQASRELASQASQNRRQAAQNVANMSGQLADRDVNLASQKASAADEIARFNAMNRQNVAQHNLANRQNIANQQTGLRNQQQQYNKGLIQQDFKNRMMKATGMANQLGNQATAFQNQASREAQAAQQKSAGMTGLLGTGLMAGATYFASDERVKENIEETDSSKIQDMLNKLQGYEYDYKEEVGGMEDNTGIMAQDLEQSELGSNMVEESPEGVKMIDKDKMLSTLMASLADMNKRVNELEGGDNFQEGGHKIQKSGDDTAGGSRFSVDELNEVLEQLKAMSGQEFYDGGMKMMPTISGEVASSENIDPDKFSLSEGQLGAMKMLGKALQNTPQVAPAQMQARKNINTDALMNMIGGKFSEGGNPTSYTEGGERIDELVDAGELSVNTDAQNELMEMLRGNLDSDEMSDSRIVEGDSYSGDLLPDRINSGEMVLALGQQDKIKDEIQNSDDEARGFKKLIGMLGKK